MLALSESVARLLCNPLPLDVSGSSAAGARVQRPSQMDRPVGVISLLVGALALIFLMTGCGAAEPDVTWKRIRDQGTIRIGMDANWVPFEYVDGAGQLLGFDVDLARELGTRLELEVRFFANLSFDGLYDALTAQQVDAVISAVVVDLGRSADFAYSVPYFDAGQVLVVGPGSNEIDGPEDLQHRVLAVELGSNGDMVARRWARRLTELSLRHTDSVQAALTAVADVQADAALTDRATALMALKSHREGKASLAHAGLQISGRPVTGEQYAIVVRRESSALLRALNAALVDMRDDGTLDTLEKKWLGP